MIVYRSRLLVDAGHNYLCLNATGILLEGVATFLRVKPHKFHGTQQQFSFFYFLGPSRDLCPSQALAKVRAERVPRLGLA